MTNHNKQRLSTVILLLLAAFYLYIEHSPDESSGSTSHSTVTVATDNAHQLIQEYYTNKTSGKMIVVTATVHRILSDDTHEPRHQRFILSLNSGMTVLVAHNIDLAPRVSGLQIGDTVTVNGQYEWNDQGGVLHWTHHDPKGRRDGGQIEHNGKIYQ